MDIKLQNKNCMDVSLSGVADYFLAEYRSGFKTIVFKMFNNAETIEWCVEDPELILNKIDMLMEFYCSNICGNLSQKYYNLEEL